MKRALYLLLSVFFSLPVFAQSIHISVPADTICDGSYVNFTARASGVSSLHYVWQVNRANAGRDSSGFTTNLLRNNDTVTCLLMNGANDTVLAVSDSIIVTVEQPLTIHPITGDTMVCVSATISLTDNTPGGVWTTTNDHAAVTSGLVTGIRAEAGWDNNYFDAIDTVIYSIRNSCGIVSAAHKIDIVPQPFAYFYLGYGPYYYGNTLCLGQAVMVNGGDGVNGMLYSTTGNVKCNLFSVIGIRQGNDYLYCVATNSCGSDTSGMSVTVIDTPRSATILPDTTICANDTLLVDYSNAITFSNGNLIQIPDYGNYHIAITGISQGADTVYITSSGRCATTHSISVISVSPPGNIVGNDTVCIGASVSLQNSTAGGVWHNSSPAVATISAAGYFTPVTTGIDSVSYSFGSCVVSKKIKVKDKLPGISGPDNVCRGGTIKLSDTEPHGYWQPADTTIVTTDSFGKVSAIAAGSTTVSYRLSGCTATYPVTVHRSALIGQQMNICNGSMSQLSAQGKGTWYIKSDSSIATVSWSGSLKGIKKGITTLVYVQDTGCSDTAIVTVSSCDAPVSLFPNPAKSRLTMHADRNNYFAYEVMNTAGKVLLPRTHLDADFTSVNVQLLPPGEYLVVLYGYSETTFGARFIKE